MPKKKGKSSPIADFNELNGKTFVIIAVEESGEGVAFNGIARWDGRRLYWERAGLARPIEIPDHRLSSVRATTARERARMWDAEYLVLLSISNLPEDAPPEEYVKTSLQWPP